MSLILRIPGVSFTNTSIPIIRNDTIANSGTLSIFDALEPDISWPKQSDPIEGTDTWKSITDSSVASFSGSVGWSNGFTVDDTAVSAIALPNTFKPSTGSRCVIFWFKTGTQVTPASIVPILGWFGTGTGDSPYYVYIQETNTMVFTQGNGGPQVLLTLTAPTTVQQFAFSFQPTGAGGTYDIKFFRNGSLVATRNTGLTALSAPASSPKLGNITGTPRRTIATYYRAVADNLTATTPEALVALDYATYSSRFA